MKHLFSWVWNGENFGLRLLLVVIAGAGYIGGAGWGWPDPVWIAGGVAVIATAAASKPAKPPAGGS